MIMLPLTGVRVLDLTRVLAGPLSTQMLADLGAEVIKIERPKGGDDSRAVGPPYLVDPEGKQNNNNAFFLSANRSKKSVTIDIAMSRGQQIVRDLARSVDVMVENFKVGDLKRYGLDYESIRKVNPGIVYCSVTGFGQTGPYKERPGYDPIFQAMGGLMSVTGHANGLPGAGPMKVGPSIIDVMTGMNATIGILASLYHKKTCNVGQQVDVCLLDTVIASLSHYAQGYLINGETPPRRGNAGSGSAPTGTFRCSDGEIMLVVGNDAQFVRCCGMLGRPDLTKDPRYVTNNSRFENKDELIAVFQTLFSQQPREHWLQRLAEIGVPAGPINDFDQAFSDAQVRHRGMRVKVAHPLDASLSLIANPIKFSETPIRDYAAPPLLGEHTESILREKLGYSSADLAMLREEQVI